jgi:hypothetical protein
LVVPLLSTWMTLPPSQNLPLQSSSECSTIDYIIFLLPFWCTASSTHPSCPIHTRHCPSISILASWYYIWQTQSQCSDHTYFTTWKLQLITTKVKPFYFQKHGPDPLQIHIPLCPGLLQYAIIGLVLDSELLYTQHLHTVANRATDILWNNFPLLAQD